MKWLRFAPVGAQALRFPFDVDVRNRWIRLRLAMVSKRSVTFSRSLAAQRSSVDGGGDPSMPT